MTVRERVQQLIAAFQKVYPDAHCELDFKTPLQLLIATILSAQCTDKRVNLVTPKLFARYRTAADFAKAPPAQLEEQIRSTGFFRSKTKSIKGAATAIVEKHRGKVPDTMAELHALPGVGRKTANVVLGNAFHKDEGIVVDTHVIRLSNRFRLTRQTDPEKIEDELMKIVPREHWTIWSHWLIWHGRRRCFARLPDCRRCEVFASLPERQSFYPHRSGATATERVETANACFFSPFVTSSTTWPTRDAFCRNVRTRFQFSSIHRPKVFPDRPDDCGRRAPRESVHRASDAPLSHRGFACFESGKP